MFIKTFFKVDNTHTFMIQKAVTYTIKLIIHKIRNPNIILIIKNTIDKKILGGSIPINIIANSKEGKKYVKSLQAILPRFLNKNSM